jgi:hypothetical protein
VTNNQGLFISDTIKNVTELLCSKTGGYLKQLLRVYVRLGEAVIKYNSNAVWLFLPRHHVWHRTQQDFPTALRGKDRMGLHQGPIPASGGPIQVGQQLSHAWRVRLKKPVQHSCP